MESRQVLISSCNTYHMMPLMNQYAAITECSKLAAVFAQAFDQFDHERLLSMTTPTFTWLRPGMPPIEGREEFRKLLTSRTKNVLGRHLVSSIVIDVLGDKAKGLSYYTYYMHKGETQAVPPPIRTPYSIGEYHDEFVLIEGGWMMNCRDTRPTFHGHAST